jgi:hypothetical protein
MEQVATNNNSNNTNNTNNAHTAAFIKLPPDSTSSIASAIFPTKQKVTTLLEIYPSADRVSLPVKFCGFSFDYQQYDFTKASIKVLSDPVMTLELMESTVKYINEAFQLNKIHLLNSIRKRLYLVLGILTLLSLIAVLMSSIFVVTPLSDTDKLLFGIFLPLTYIFVATLLIGMMYWCSNARTSGITIQWITNELLYDLNQRLLNGNSQSNTNHSSNNGSSNNTSNDIFYEWKLVPKVIEYLNEERWDQVYLHILVCEKRLLLSESQNETKEAVTASASLKSCDLCYTRQSAHPVTFEPYAFCTNCGTSFVSPAPFCACADQVSYSDSKELNYDRHIARHLPHKPRHRFCANCGLRKHLDPFFV